MPIAKKERRAFAGGCGAHSRDRHGDALRGGRADRFGHCRSSELVQKYSQARFVVYLRVLSTVFNSFWTTLLCNVWFLATTHRCILRNLRLCCVSTTELTPQPNFNIDRLANLKRTRSVGDGAPASNSSSNKSNAFFELDRICAIQSARCCFFLSPQELVTSVVPVFQPSSTASTASSPHRTKSAAHSSDLGGGDSGLVFTSDFSMNLQQYVIIDIRSYEDTVVSGAGAIPR